MNAKMKKTSFSLVILAIFIISSGNFASAGLDQLGVEAGDTFTFVVEKESSTSDGPHGFSLYGLLLHEGEKFTVEVVNAFVHDESFNWIYLDITHNGTTTRHEQTIEGDGAFIISNDWTAQRSIFDSGIEFLNLLIDSYGGTGEASVIDETDQYGLTYDYQFTQASADFAISQTKLYEKSTGVLISDEWSSTETKTTPPDRKDEYYLVREGFGEEGGILDDLPGFGLFLSISSIMVIIISLRFRRLS